MLLEDIINRENLEKIGQTIRSNWHKYVIVGSLPFIASCIVKGAEAMNPTVEPSETTRPTATSTVTPSATMTHTITPTRTKADMPLCNITGTVFFDNVIPNGIFDSEIGEMPIPNVSIYVNSINQSKPDMITDSSGNYFIDDIKCGLHDFYFISPNFENDYEDYRFINFSEGPPQPISKPIKLNLSNNLTLDVALMQGFETWPFSCDTAYSLGALYDHDKDSLEYRDFKGNTSPWQWDNHEAWDIIVPTGTKVYAAAGGTVNYAGVVGNGCLTITLDHFILGGQKVQTGYGHLSEILVTVGQKVNRGDLIGISGSTCTSGPHLHFPLYLTDGEVVAIDHARDLFDPEALSYWVVDNSPICLQLD